nr:hypothetical protein [Tanacetum cinerariifolium]
MEAGFDGIMREEKHRSHHIKNPRDKEGYMEGMDSTMTERSTMKLGDVDYNEELHLGSLVTLILVGVTQRLQSLIALLGLLYDLSNLKHKLVLIFKSHQLLIKLRWRHELLKNGP